MRKKVERQKEGPDSSLLPPETNTGIMNVKIDPEFAQLCPALTSQEYKELEEDIRANGCLNPITILKGHGIILDGHNRYKICRKLNISFEVNEVEFKSRDDAKNWVLTNQLARRNLSLYPKFLLVVEREDIKAKREAARKRSLSNLKQFAGKLSGGNSTDLSIVDISDKFIGLQERIALELGVSTGTVAKMQFIQRASVEGKLDQETLKGIMEGTLTINSVYNSLRKRGINIANIENKVGKENNMALIRFEKIIAEVNTLPQQPIPDILDIRARNEVLASIKEAQDVLKKLYVAVSYHKKWPEISTMYLKGKMSYGEMQGVIRKESRTKSKTQASGRKDFGQYDHDVGDANDDENDQEGKSEEDIRL